MIKVTSVSSTSTDGQRNVDFSFVHHATRNNLAALKLPTFTRLSPLVISRLPDILKPKFRRRSS
jgi:hypothetical protein